jgi:putative selenium metabolism hydrolase
MSKIDLRSLVDGARDRIVDFAQRTIQTPSLSGDEKQMADLVQNELRSLGFVDAHIDEVGNVLVKLGGGSGPSTLLHAHLDIVDPGDISRWSHPPFAGDIAEGYLWGRGSSDTKGSVVAQVYALGLLREAGLRPAGDAYFAGVVGEEIAGMGTYHLLTYLKPDLAIIGEPSHNILCRAHRGRFDFAVTFYGRSAHASAPELGLNPHYSLARFLLALRETPMVHDDIFGGTSFSPTLVEVDQTSSNVIPAEVTIHLDWRNSPRETLEQAQALIQRVANDSLDPDISVKVKNTGYVLRSYTGLTVTIDKGAAAMYMDADDPLLLLAHSILEGALARPVDVDVWHFCTDGGKLYDAGIPCIGFGPGDPALAHVLDERLEIEELLEATVAYMALAIGMGETT